MTADETQGDPTLWSETTPDQQHAEGQHPDAPPAGDRPAPGQTWGKYLIEKPLGRGGQAEVFQAYDQFGAAGHVALKVPRRPIPPEQAQAWAAAEAEPLVQLDHPNIVRVRDAGCVGRTPYVAADLVEGMRLSEFVKRNPPPLRQVLRWMVQLADAVAYAHDRGVTHRDLKPQNVLVGADEADCPKIIDFALARLTDPYGPDELPGTSGTPGYMAPEQARGEAEADHRVDVFALGGILKFLLDGHGPYPRASNTREALETARQGRVQPADAEAGPLLRRSLARIANRALEADAERRYATARQMLRALRSLASRRRFVGVSLAAAMLAAGAVAAGYVFRLAPGVPTATLEVHFQRPGEGDVYHVLSPRSGPLRTGDRIQIHARLSEPLYAYIVAVNPKGEMAVLYPQGDQAARRTERVDLPAAREVWLGLEEPPGTETVLLLARREPLADGEALKRELASLGAAPKLGGPGLIVADADGVRIIERRLEPDRSISTRTTKAKKGMLASLLDRVPEKWTLVRGLCFLHAPAAARGDEDRGGP